MTIHWQRKLFACMVAVFMLLSLLAISSCQKNASSGQSTPPNDEDGFTAESSWKENQDESIQPSILQMPVLFKTALIQQDEISIYVPQFVGPNSFALNNAVREAIFEYASGLSGISGVSYELAYSDRSIVSIWFVAYNLVSAPGTLGQDTTNKIEVERFPFNYDICAAGEITFGSLFGEAYTKETATLLSEMITKLAVKQGYTLLGKLTPVPENQRYIITDKGITICYREYEIAVSSEGTPLIMIPYSEFAKLEYPDFSVAQRLIDGD